MKELPSEILCDIVDYCDAKDVTHVLRVSRRFRGIAHDISRQRALRLVGKRNGGLVLRVFSPDSEDNEVRWFCSCGAHVTETVTHLKMQPARRVSESDEPEPNAPSISSPPGVALDIEGNGYFGHVVLQVYFALADYGNRPLAMLRVALRVSVDCADQGVVHMDRDGVRFELRVTRESNEPFRNKFGELVHRYRVSIASVTLSTCLLLSHVEKLRSSSVLVRVASAGRIDVFG